MSICRRLTSPQRLVNTAAMNESEKRIAAAALRVFARYGVKRATMADVAKEADVVRQSLYNVYSNKDALLRGAIRLYADDQWEKINAGWDQAGDLGEKLDILFEHFILETWNLMNSSPDAKELTHGYNAAGREEILLIEEQTIGNLEAILAPFAAAFAEHGETTASVADHLLVSISGIKYGATSLKQAAKLADTQKALILALAKKA